MKAFMLLFWIPAHTIVLQPSLNVSVLHNASAESDLGPELRLDWTAETFTTEEERRNEKEDTVQGAGTVIDTVQSKRDGEHGMKKIEIKEETAGQTGSDVKKQEVVEKNKQRQMHLDERDTPDVIQEDNEEEQMTDNPFLSAWKTTPTQAVEEHLAPTAQTIKQYSTSPTKTTASQPVLTESVHKKAILLPSFPSISQSPSAIAENISITSLPSETATTNHHLLNSTAEAMGANLLVNRSRTNDDLIVALHVTNSFELHLLEEQSVGSTAVAARAGPTAEAPPNSLMAKPKNKVAGAKPKGNTTMKTKTRKLQKKDRGKEKKKTKALKKEKKVRKEKKLKPTTASYFPYFEDHYCPPECSCYGRVVQCSNKDLDKIPYGIPYNSRYILLMNNYIDSIQLNLLSEYNSMEFLVLSNNRLTDAAIEGAFEGIQSLKRLYMEQNLLQNIPINLPASLEELRLDGNQVNRMSAAAFGRCPSLLILSLSNNSLGNQSSTIPPGVLLSLGNLRTLTLSYNHLTSIPLQLPLSLRELYLRGNLIQRLQGDVFWGQAELQMLDLSANRLSDKGLGKAALLNASRLESLNLGGNLLKQIPRHLPRTIKILNLEGNFISSISKDAFISMPQLEHLGLAQNKITKVAVGAFRILPLLHHLDLSRNALRQVPRQLPLWLHSATFAHNKICVVPRDAFCWGQGHRSPVSRLVRFQLEHNMIDLGHLDTLAFRCLRGFQVVQFY